VSQPSRVRIAVVEPFLSVPAEAGRERQHHSLIPGHRIAQLAFVTIQGRNPSHGRSECS